MANLASATEKYNLASGQTLAAGSVMLTSMVPFLRANTPTQSIEKATGGIQEPLTSIRKVFEDIVNVFKGINREHEKQTTILDRMERTEDEERQERSNIIRQTAEQDDDNETSSDETTSVISAVIRRILSTIIRAFRSLVNAMISLARNMVRIMLLVLRSFRLIRGFASFLRDQVLNALGISIRDLEIFQRLDQFQQLLENFANESESTTGRPSRVSRRENEINQGQRPELPIGDFNTEVRNVSERLGIRPEDLLLVMAAESRLGEISPDAAARIRHPSSSATGLIQFMESTAGMLGTTTSRLASMSAAEQMRYVEAYFRHVGLPRGANAATIYAYVFLPARARNPDGILTRRGENYYNANPNLDANSDGTITIDDLGEVLRGRQNRAYRLPQQGSSEGSPPPPQPTASPNASPPERRTDRISAGRTYATTSSNRRIPPSNNETTSEILIVPFIARV